MTAIATYPREQLYQEMAYIAYHFHWSIDDILDMEHEERHVWLREIARIRKGETIAPREGVLPPDVQRSLRNPTRLEKVTRRP